MNKKFIFGLLGVSFFIVAVAVLGIMVFSRGFLANNLNTEITEIADSIDTDSSSDDFDSNSDLDGVDSEEDTVQDDEISSDLEDINSEIDDLVNQTDFEDFGQIDY